MSNDNLGDRMKDYESVTRVRLVPKMPVMIRLDGKAFHTLTRNMDKPVDFAFQKCMWKTAQHLCEQIQGVQVAYVQSDEITLLLVDYQSIKTQPWFDYEVQKICSIAAGMASAEFSEQLERRGVFDCRAWNLPAHEVVNCFIWRQQDATRNSISGLAQAHFSAKQLHGKNTSQMQDMLMLEKGINWNDCPVPQKRGVCVVKETYEALYSGPAGIDAYSAVRTRWVVDEAIPIFTQDRSYIQRFVDVQS
jgi:tRNA(His) 5'-end guanylyltransferase